MAEPTRQPKMLAPDLVEMANGCLSLSFDAPLDRPERVDWLLVRNWLTAEFGAAFEKAFEYPTFEWFVRMTLPTTSKQVQVELWWSDFPDELTLESTSITDNAVILEVRAKLADARPRLGDLRAMDVRAWRAWMATLGSPNYAPLE